MKHIQKYTAKITDSRSSGYIKTYGNESWELDALNPQVINDIIQEEVASLTDFDLLEKKKEEERNQKKILSKYADMAEKEGD